jgi:4-amino-4-deoxy-L-arabinose transferase-like glycosyltransferase
LDFQICNYLLKLEAVKWPHGLRNPTGIIPIVKPRAASFALLFLLIAVIAAPRLMGLDKFATIDEPYWLTAGSDFYYALGQRDFRHTVYDYHPAVTTMWIIAGAMLTYFPGYRGLGQGYFDVYKNSLDTFLLAHSKSPLGLLTQARLIQTVVVVVLLIGVFLLLRRLHGTRMAVVGATLISFDPFFLGHSRLLNHEALMSLFAVISLLSLVVYLFSERLWGYLIVSGAAAGAAELTKSSSTALLPLVAGLFLLALVYKGRLDTLLSSRVLLGRIALWLGTFGLIYVLLWPGMWVAPRDMLGEVFGNAISYATEGSRLSVVSSATATGFHPRLADIGLFVQSMLWRTTPVAWLGAVLLVPALLVQRGVQRISLLALAALGAIFVVMFGLASGRNSAHYVLTSYVALDILAAAGLAAVTDSLLARSSGAARRAVAGLVLGAAVVYQGASAIAFYPYFYTYFNPIMEAQQSGVQDPNFGYGEGLDLAAAYLAEKPDAANSTAMAFYGRGPFSFFYPGDTEPLKTVYADAENVPQLQQILHKSDYLVIYYALEKGRNSPANVMQALQGIEPEKSIWLDGIEYVRIYALQGMPAEFFTRLEP